MATSDSTGLTPLGALALGIGLAIIGGALLTVDNEIASALAIVVLVVAGLIGQIGAIAVGVQLALTQRDRVHS